MFQKTLTGGRYNESNYPVQELWRKRGGGRIFEGGVLAGHYGIISNINKNPKLWKHNKLKTSIRFVHKQKVDNYIPVYNKHLIKV